MRSDNNQLDIFDHDPRINAPKLAKAFRAAAEHALTQFEFTASVRQERHEYYLGEAKRLEAEMRLMTRGPRHRRHRAKERI
jgi:hypothetical protein